MKTFSRFFCLASCFLAFGGCIMWETPHTTPTANTTMQTTENKTSARPQPSPKRECHKCPLNGKGDDYCWKTCLGPAEDSRKGKSLVSLSAMPAQDEYINREADELTGYRKSEPPAVYATPPSAEPQGVVDAMSYETERSLVRVLATIMSLSDVQLCIFRHIYLGEHMEAVGESLPVPISKQAVSKHVQSLRAKHPALDHMLSQMLRSATARRPAHTRPAPQADEAHGFAPLLAKGSVAQLDLFSGVAIGGIYRRGGNAPAGSRQRNPVTRTREGHYTAPTADLSS